MKKKGFTLVELLAVIAILAILVIIALPNVMGMFNTAKKNSFSNEVKEIIKQAETQYVSDNSDLFGTEVKSSICYQGKMDNDTTSATITDAKALDMSGRKISYGLCFNQAGKITSIAATDGTYVVSYQADDIQKIDIKTGEGAYTANDGKVYTITDTTGKTGASITYTDGKVSAVLTPAS